MKKLRTPAAIAMPLIIAFAGLSATSMPASAADSADLVIKLPGATSAEGIALGSGSTFYAGDEFGGDIFRGDLTTGVAEKFIDVPGGITDNPPGGRMAVGMKVDLDHSLLFVAGGVDGTARVYDTTSGAEVADLQLADPAGGPVGVNDVALTDKGAWFTDSYRSTLYFVPVSATGAIGSPQTLQLTGPAAQLTGQFNNNGIVAGPKGEWLIVGHTENGVLNKVDPTTGASSTIAGVSATAQDGFDGLLLDGLKLYAVEAWANQILEVDLSGDLSSGTMVSHIRSSEFETPTTMAQYGGRLAVVNSHLNLGFPPPPGTSFEVLMVPTN